MNKDTVISTLTEYYKNLGIPVPKTTVEYIKNYPKGYSNSTLSTKGIKLREVLDIINKTPAKSPSPTTYKEALTLAKDWLASGKILPTTYRNWAKLSINKGEIPFTIATATKYNFSILEILNELNISSRNKNTYHDLEEVCTNCKVTLIEYTYPTAMVECILCGRKEQLQKYTLIDRVKRGIVGCSYCNKIPGVVKDLEYYQEQIPPSFKLISITDQIATIVHSKCSNVLHRGIRYITRSNRDSLVCEYCDNKAIREEGFSSSIERTIVTYILNNFSDLDFSREVMYKNIVITDRQYRADLYSKKLNLVLEITHKDTKFLGYLENLNNKLELLRMHGVQAYKVCSIAEVEDIVSTLLKNKE